MELFGTDLNMIQMVVHVQLGYGAVNSKQVCFGRKTKFFRESEDFLLGINRLGKFS